MPSSALKLQMAQAYGLSMQIDYITVLNYLAKAYWLMLHMQPMSLLL